MTGELTARAARTQPVRRFTLTAPLDAALVEDGRVFHGVTAVRPLDAGGAAYRDVLVVTLRRQR